MRRPELMLAFTAALITVQYLVWNPLVKTVHLFPVLYQSVSLDMGFYYVAMLAYYQLILLISGVCFVTIYTYLARFIRDIIE